MTITNKKLETWLSALPEESRKHFIDMAKIIKPIIEGIHNRDSMYQNYYGEYMAKIGQLMDRYSTTAQGSSPKYWGVIFIMAGANPLGVEAAVKNL